MGTSVTAPTFDALLPALLKPSVPIGAFAAAIK
jgi:hypothetical protein